MPRQSASDPIEAKGTELRVAVLLCIVLVKRVFAFRAYHKTTITFRGHFSSVAAVMSILKNLISTFLNEKDNRLFRDHFVT